MARISPSVLLIALFPAAVFAQTNLYLPPDVTDGDKAQMGGYTMAQIEAWTASFGMVNSWRNTPSAWANSTNVDPNGGLGELFIKGVRKRVHNLKLISGGSGVVVTGIYAILMESGTISAMEKLTLQFGTSTGKPAAAGMNRRNVDMNLQPLINKQWYEATPARPPNYRPARPPNYRPPSPPSAPASETYWGDTSGADTYLFTRDDVMDPGCYHVGVDPHDETKALLVAVVGAGWAQKRITAAVFKIGDGTSSVPEPPLGFQQVRSAFSISYPGVTIEPAGLDLKNILDQTGGYVSMCSHTLFGTNGRPITWSLLKGSANRTAAPWHVQEGALKYDPKIFPQYIGPEAASPLSGAGAIAGTSAGAIAGSPPSGAGAFAGTSAGAIAGISVGSTVVAAAIIFGALRKRKRSKSAQVRVQPKSNTHATDVHK